MVFYRKYLCNFLLPWLKADRVETKTLVVTDTLSYDNLDVTNTIKANTVEATSTIRAPTVEADNLVLTHGLTFDTLTLSGDLTAANLTALYKVAGNSAEFRGALTAGSATFYGSLVAPSATLASLSGSTATLDFITGQSGTWTGTLNALAGTFTGDVRGATGTFTTSTTTPTLILHDGTSLRGQLTAYSTSMLSRSYGTSGFSWTGSTNLTLMTLTQAGLLQVNRGALSVSQYVNCGQSYRISSIDVLTSTTLGSPILYSSLTTLGTLKPPSVGANALNVDGNAHITGNLIVDGTATFQDPWLTELGNRVQDLETTQALQDTTIAGLTAGATAMEFRVDALSGTVGGLSATVSALETYVYGTVDATLSSHTTTLAQHTEEIQVLDNASTSHTVELDNHETRITRAEGTLVTLALNMDGISTANQITTIQNTLKVQNKVIGLASEFETLDLGPALYRNTARAGETLSVTGNSLLQGDVTITGTLTNPALETRLSALEGSSSGNQNWSNGLLTTTMGSPGNVNIAKNVIRAYEPSATSPQGRCTIAGDAVFDGTVVMNSTMSVAGLSVNTLTATTNITTPSLSTGGLTVTSSASIPNLTVSGTFSNPEFTSMNTRLTTAESTLVSQDTRITTLETSGLEPRVVALEDKTQALTHTTGKTTVGGALVAPLEFGSKQTFPDDTADWNPVEVSLFCRGSGSGSYGGLKLSSSYDGTQYYNSAVLEGVRVGVASYPTVYIKNAGLTAITLDRTTAAVTLGQPTTASSTLRVTGGFFHQPPIYSVQRGTNQTLTVGAWAPVLFDTLVFQSSTASTYLSYTNSTGILKNISSFTMYIDLKASLTFTAAASVGAQLCFQKNNASTTAVVAPYYGNAVLSAGSANVPTTLAATTVLTLAPNEYCNVFIKAAAAVSITGGSGYSSFTATVISMS